MPTNDTEMDLLHAFRTESGNALPVDIWYEGDIWVIRPIGSIDTTTSSDLEVNLLEGINQGMRWIVMDLTDVPYISSAGLRVLILGMKTLKKTNGEMRLSSPNKTVLDLIEMTGLKKIFRVYSDNESAVHSFHQS